MAENLEELIKNLLEKGLTWEYCTNCPSKDLKSIDNVLNEIERTAIESYLKFDIDKLPKPYIKSNQKLKAFLLGCDPGNKSDGGETKKFEYVFGLEDDKSPYFMRSIMPNIVSIDLDLENLYVQNLCKNYFNMDTYKHKGEWKKCANLWLPLIREELDTQDKSRKLPILITSEIILEVVLLFKKPPNKDIYDEIIIFDEESNYFGRKAISLYRSPKYRLAKWKAYTEKIKHEILITDGFSD